MEIFIGMAACEACSYSGMKDLLRETVSRGWLVIQGASEIVISVCSQCCTRLEKHALQNPPLHLRTGKRLWEIWQVNCIGPFNKSGGKQYVLMGVQIVSSLMQAKVVAWSTGESTVKGLK